MAHIQLNATTIDKDLEKNMDINIVYQAKDNHLKGDNEMDVDKDLMDVNGDLTDVDEDLMDVNKNNIQIGQKVGDYKNIMDADDIQSTH
ncbi:hypothetical protein BDR04DRAFT_1162111 [Suillus decipiens]|nr:hypothetical protein BDR04DRAFT_1162111 [Suillus decipiens]